MDYRDAPSKANAESSCFKIHLSAYAYPCNGVSVGIRIKLVSNFKIHLTLN